MKAGRRGSGEAGRRTAENGRAGMRARVKGGSVPKRALLTKSGKKRLPRFPASPPAAEIISLLKEAYPDARCALEHRNAYELLCATILSAQCTDARVNMVTPTLFARYPTPFELARAKPADVEEIIKSTGFFRNKTKSLIGMAQAVVADHGGEVPRTMEELRKLPGVGRKTANLVVTLGFGKPGICVDTHVHRITNRWGYVRTVSPDATEAALRRKLPPEYWIEFNDLLVPYGQHLCAPVSPFCSQCDLRTWCRRVGVTRSR